MEMTVLNKGTLIEYKNDAYKITLGFMDEKGIKYVIRKCSGKRQYTIVGEEELLEESKPENKQEEEIINTLKHITTEDENE